MRLKRLQGLFFAVLVGLAFMLPRLCLSASCPSVAIEHSCCAGMSGTTQNISIQAVCCVQSSRTEAIFSAPSKHFEREQKEILFSFQAAPYLQAKSVLALQTYTPTSTPPALKLRTLSTVLRI